MDRLRVIVTNGEERFAEAVIAGLDRAPKTLPCRFFYDLEGSRLFEKISQEPSYYLTRTEREILAESADEIVGEMGEGLSVVELGGGNSIKTRLLIDAILRRQSRLHFTNVDISQEYLEDSAKALLADYPNLEMDAIAAEYGDAFDLLPASDGPRLFLFMGSNIGNSSPGEAGDLLCRLSSIMDSDDALLVGIDRLKDPAIIEAAYNDENGITEAFNRNILARINRELGGNFDIEMFVHRARFRPEKGRIEMHLVSAGKQTVDVLGRSFGFKQGESIQTEECAKYSRPQFAALAASVDLRVDRSWTNKNEWFDVHLLRLANGG
ncbi:MAG: L-histidine N(alpha)-methyltransferase [Armatimonadetes bacterium]|nr:L-histidine N(alpha)-methyltransferase [Armatimonadota bacterium]